MTNINAQTVIISLLTLIVGFGGGFIMAGQEPSAGEHMMPNGAMMDDSGMSMGSAMDDMMAGLAGKSGDEFDKAFISDMIVHHEGAVDMAEAALTNAKHEEVKQLAHDIIDAQTREIGQMRDWQRNWYGQ